MRRHTVPKNEGAFVEAVRYIVNKDIEAKTAIVQDIVDNPDKYPGVTTQDIFALIFGNYQDFANKWSRHDP